MRHIGPESVGGRPAGRLILVVGPSGAGKDSLIDGAKRLLGRQRGIVFPRRQITRSAALGGEDHVAIDAATFHARERAGAYSLSWRANGHAYGIGTEIEGHLAAGRAVVVNVSRTVLVETRKSFPDLKIINVTAPKHLIAARLAARGREAGPDIARRLDRATRYIVYGADVYTFENVIPLDEAIWRFTNLVRQLAALSKTTPVG